MWTTFKLTVIAAVLALAWAESASADAAYDKHTANQNAWATGFLKNSEEGRVFDFGQFIHIKTAAGVVTIKKVDLNGKAKHQIVEHITSEVVASFNAAGPSVILATGAAESVATKAAEEAAANAAKIAAHNAAGSAAATIATNEGNGGKNLTCTAMGCK